MNSSILKHRRHPRFARWATVVAALLAAALWARLAAGAPSSLVVWLPSVVVAIALCFSFVAVSAVAAKGNQRAALLLASLSAIAILLLLFAPALALGGPMAGAPASVICGPGTGLCWKYLHSAFVAQAVLFATGALLAARARAVGATGEA